MNDRGNFHGTARTKANDLPELSAGSELGSRIRMIPYAAAFVVSVAVGLTAEVIKAIANKEDRI